MISEHVTLTVSVCGPEPWFWVFHWQDAVVPVVITVSMTVLSTINVKTFWSPTAPLTLALIVTVPVTFAPAAGRVICTAGCTWIVRVGGLGLLIPKLSRTVSDTTEVPAVGNLTFPGFNTVLVFGLPDGKYQE